MFGIGFWFADVMGDSIVAEKAKLEPEESRGQLQSTCYSCRFFGLMIMSPVSTVLYTVYGPKCVIQLLAFVPLLILPFIYDLWEPRHLEIKSTKEQCSEIWRTVCSRAVWQPMAFVSKMSTSIQNVFGIWKLTLLHFDQVYLYNVLQIGNAAWREFLKSVLGFQDYQLNILMIAASVLLYVGIMAYKYYFIKWSWRSIYIATTILNAFLSSLQIFLIQGVTFGLSPFAFALGDDIFADFIGA